MSGSGLFAFIHWGDIKDVFSSRETAEAYQKVFEAFHSDDGFPDETAVREVIIRSEVPPVRKAWEVRDDVPHSHDVLMFDDDFQDYLKRTHFYASEEAARVAAPEVARLRAASVEIFKRFNEDYEKISKVRDDALGALGIDDN